MNSAGDSSAPWLCEGQGIGETNGLASEIQPPCQSSAPLAHPVLQKAPKKKKKKKVAVERPLAEAPPKPAASVSQPHQKPVQKTPKQKVPPKPAASVSQPHQKPVQKSPKQKVPPKPAASVSQPHQKPVQKTPKQKVVVEKPLPEAPRPTTSVMQRHELSLPLQRLIKFHKQRESGTKKKVAPAQAHHSPLMTRLDLSSEDMFPALPDPIYSRTNIKPVRKYVYRQPNDKVLSAVQWPDQEKVEVTIKNYTEDAELGAFFKNKTRNRVSQDQHTKHAQRGPARTVTTQKKPYKKRTWGTSSGPLFTASEKQQRQKLTWHRSRNHRTHHNQDRHTRSVEVAACCVCGARPSVDRIAAHVATHINREALACILCHKAIVTWDDHEEHLKCHSDVDARSVAGRLAALLLLDQACARRDFEARCFPSRYFSLKRRIFSPLAPKGCVVERRLIDRLLYEEGLRSAFTFDRRRLTRNHDITLRPNVVFHWKPPRKHLKHRNYNKLRNAVCRGRKRGRASKRQRAATREKEERKREQGRQRQRQRRDKVCAQASRSWKRHALYVA